MYDTQSSVVKKKASDVKDKKELVGNVDSVGCVQAVDILRASSSPTSNLATATLLGAIGKLMPQF